MLALIEAMKLKTGLDIEDSIDYSGELFLPIVNFLKSPVVNKDYKINFSKIRSTIAPAWIHVNELLDNLEMQTLYDFEAHYRTFMFTELQDWKVCYGISTWATESPGVYLFEINYSKHFASWIESNDKTDIDGWIKEVTSTWSTGKKKNKVLKQYNIYEHCHNKMQLGLDFWMPLYVGKANNLSRRISEHLESHNDGSSLQLSRSSLLTVMPEAKIRLSTSRALTVLENDDIFMAQLPRMVELRLMERLRPIIGRK
ncbi:hypothetical protein [Paenibacillus elgii]|uniref:hypothetical protein n=1 Tax=Paenibacillus elgii TaxID=189691 RepID=UPI00203C73D7|nr:hypothetical protein [Paenibacillus elgii]MCM3271214.1 hypothetical protein [Paenibacillus elgii]